MRKLFQVSIFRKNYVITSFYGAKLIPGYYFMKNNREFYCVSLTRSRVIKKMSLTHHFIFYHTFICKYLLSLLISTSSSIVEMVTMSRICCRTRQQWLLMQHLHHRFYILGNLYESHILVDNKDSFNKSCVLSMLYKSIIGCDDFNLILLQEHLDLSNNYFNGGLPFSGSQDKVRLINLSGNKFDGHIPPTIKGMKSLEILYLFVELSVS